ncbi:hypothetical protein bwei_5760 [Bacillus mycoides]|uniref:hypothetical protein n=1 Tax=Bacillus mycoides TaxID=1405 RepID=UPI0001A052D3|nr:hypothetical protein [Bacillus mycoides]AIW88269.1 hypothetical protein bwei_5760 [Bacillus mycoides]EEL02975.1 hypothetical protein bcere0014_54690 [Bacillus cereus BDRD-ST196]GAE43226.1 hypothetical protein BW1_082_00180 [Bacillus mycoides NBRC 101238 = DSM 11821]
MKQKKLLKHILFGLGILTGGSMIGLDSVSADTLKDKNGNSVQYGKSYYLEASAYDYNSNGISQRKGINYSSWNLGDWVYLNQSGQGQTIKIQPAAPLTTDRDGQNINENTIIAIQMEMTNPKFSYLSINKSYNGIQLSDFSLLSSVWIAQNVSNSDSVTIKNNDTKKYMHFKFPNDWLDATESEPSLKAKWQLVPKN